MTVVGTVGGACNEDGIGGPRGLLIAAEAWRAIALSLALVIVVETEGSTYRKPGAFAVIGINGEHHGALSGGCLESGIALLARRALQESLSCSAQFDTRSDDDLVFGSGSGCRGRMQVIAIPVVAGRPVPLYDAIAEAIHAGEMLRIAMVTEGRQLGSTVVWDSKDRIVVDTIRIDSVSRDMLRGLALGPHRVPFLCHSEIAIFEIRAAPRVVLFGAGPEAMPLLRCARTQGWFTVLADHRESLLDAHRHCADKLLCARPPAACAALDPMHFDAAIAMTHLAAADLDVLKMMAVRPIPYIGLLGPASRRDGLLAQLDGVTNNALEGRLHAPVGLALGGDGPEAIALSIVADLQQHFVQR